MQSAAACGGRAAWFPVSTRRPFMAQSFYQQPPQWSGEQNYDQGSYVEPNSFLRSGPGNHEADVEETIQRKHIGKVTDYSLEQPEEEDEGYRWRTWKSQDRKTKVEPDSYLFSWGEGKAGQLAQQATEDILIPYAVNAFLNMPIKMCALGKKHSLFLTEKGMTQPRSIPFFPAIQFCFSGMVFSCGSGLYGQLGNGAAVEIQDRAIQIRNLKDIHMIAAGHYHSIAISQVLRPRPPSVTPPPRPSRARGPRLTARPPRRAARACSPGAAARGASWATAPTRTSPPPAASPPARAPPPPQPSDPLPFTAAPADVPPHPLLRVRPRAALRGRRTAIAPPFPQPPTPRTPRTAALTHGEPLRLALAGSPCRPPPSAWPCPGRPGRRRDLTRCPVPTP